MSESLLELFCYQGTEERDGELVDLKLIRKNEDLMKIEDFKNFND